MKKISKKILSVFLATLMLLTVMPSGVINTVYADEVSQTSLPTSVNMKGSDENYKFTADGKGYPLHLGKGFNTLEIKSGESVEFLNIETDNLKVNKSVFDNSKLIAYGELRYGNAVISQSGEVTTASSAMEMMNELGIDTSTSVKGSVGLSICKASFSTKFSTQSKETENRAVEELFYQYRYTAICNTYNLSSGGDYTSLLSQSFKDDMDRLIDGSLSYDDFFDIYGTHILVGYSTGAQTSLTSTFTAESTEKMNEFKTA